MHLSNEILAFMAASLLSVFAINPAKDHKGNPILLKYDIGVELISYESYRLALLISVNDCPFSSKVKPFQIEIKPRSPEHAALLSDY